MLYNELPVFKTAYDLLLYVFQSTKTFPKEYKYTIGERIKNELVELILSIFKANTVTDKKPFLEQSQQHLEIIRLLLRIAQDIKIISLQSYTHISVLTDSVSKQLTGRKNFYTK